jgi:hypothetical protein
MGEGTTLPGLLTLDDLAAALGVTSAKTARRHLIKAMDADPGLHVVRRGRTLLFTPEQMQRVQKALEWRSPSVAGAKRGTSGGRSVSGTRPSPSGNSAQDVARELLRKRLGREKKPEFGARS